MKDDRCYRRLTSANLAFGDLISHVQLPICNEDGEYELREWPMIKPHELARAFAFSMCMALCPFPFSGCSHSTFGSS